MEIQIHAPDHPANDYKITEIGKLGYIPNLNNKHVCKDQFSEDEIRVILGANKYRNFQKGSFCFAIQRGKVDLISGKRLPVTKRDRNLLLQL